VIRADKYTRRWMALSCLALVYSLAGLSLSILFEHVGGIQPCRLCCAQRWLLAGLFAISNWSLAIHRRVLREGTVTVAPAILCIGFEFLIPVAIVGIGLYHWLIQLGVISDTCLLPPSVSTIADFRALLEKPRGCSAVSFSLFGLPTSALNFVAGLTLVFLRSLWANSKKGSRSTQLSNQTT
jgi:disulfide bond formation protein DsbB